MDSQIGSSKHKRSLSIRISDDIRQKLTYIAGSNLRSVNSHVLFLVRQDIEAFEAKHGNIQIEDEGDV